MGKNKISKKNEEKKKDKTFDDKTFGLKNKKSKKVQNFIKTVEAQVYNKSEKRDIEEKNKKKEAKKKQQEEELLLGFLTKNLDANKKKKQEEQKKFEEEKSSLEQAEDDKTGSINIFVDPREPDENRSAKVCEDFIDACEKNVYGWRWQCPNTNAKCMYTHALPEGYMLKSTMEALMKMQREEDGDKAIEFKIEEQRAKLKHDDWTPVTQETFDIWRRKRREKFLKKRKIKDKDEQNKVRGKGNQSVFLSGRALMKYDANMFKNDEDDGDDDEEEEKYEKKVEEDDKDIHELNFGIDEEEEELDKEIAKARKKMNMNEVNEVDEELFEEDADDVDLDDLE